MKTIHIFLAFLLVFVFGLFNAFIHLDDLGDPTAESIPGVSRRSGMVIKGKAEQSSCDDGRSYPWREDEQMKVIVCGGASFLGYHLSRSLLSDGHKVTILDNFKDNATGDLPHRSTHNDELHMKTLRGDDLQKHHWFDLTILDTHPCDISQLVKDIRSFKYSHLVLISDGRYDAMDTSMELSSLVNNTMGCVSKILLSLSAAPNVHFTVIQPTLPEIGASTPLPDNLKEIMHRSVKRIVYNAFHIYKMHVSVVKIPLTIGAWMPLEHELMMWLDRTHSCDSASEDYTVVTAQYAIVTDVISRIKGTLFNRCTCCTEDIKCAMIKQSEIKRFFVGKMKRLKTPRHERHNCHRSSRDFFHLKNSTLSKHTNANESDENNSAVSPDNMDKKDDQIIKEAALSEIISWHEDNLDNILPNGQHDVVFSSYFTSNLDPQSDIKQKKDNFNYMKTWYFSLKDLGLKGVIFHDGLGYEFRRKFDKSDISFHQVSLDDRSTNDARFYAYLEYLKEHPHLQRVLLTDIADVEFLKNPFNLMDILGDHLYIGRDIDTFPNMASMGWLTKRLPLCFGQLPNILDDLKILQKLDFVYNAGVIGGTRTIMIQFLGLLIDVLNQTPPDVNCNMPAVNYVVHKYFDSRVFTGYPLTSRFFFREPNPKGVFIIHK